ncbi:uncharacterized protein LOC143266195 [Megachile rotundata]|uniref:uncharacterized protein LOC143266195 n=1 Tax=Megachile rotundata TaxID=143995 RepID=UPI003FCF1F2E
MDQKRRCENILNAMCVKDKELAFNCKYSQELGRICLSCIVSAHPEAKEQWWNSGTHHFIKQEAVLKKSECIRCKIQLAELKPAIACTMCCKKIFYMEDDDDEALNAGVLMNAEDLYPIVELRSISLRNGKLHYE